MKIAIVCDYSLEYTGGAQSALMAQVRAFGNETDVVLIAPDVPDELSTLRRVSAVTPPSGPTLPGVDLPVVRATATVRAWMHRTLKHHGVNAVMVHSEFGLAATALEAARTLRIPGFHTVHTFFWRGPASAQLVAPLAKQFHTCVTGLKAPAATLADRPLDSALRGMTLAVASQADVVISPSHHQAQRLREAGLNTVVVVSNVADVGGVAGAKELVEMPALPPAQPLKLAWIGRFAPEKRLDVAIQAVEIAQNKGAQVELSIAGGPGPKQSRHTWLGTLTRAQVVDLLDESHAALLTSVGYDNQPMAVLEAGARWRPTIVCDPVLAEEFAEAVVAVPANAQAGATDSANAEALAYTIEQCVNDPSLITAAAGAAKRMATAASGPVHVAKLLTEIERVQATLNPV